MKREDRALRLRTGWIVDAAAAVMLIAAAVCLRLALVEIPNFAPVSAAALFAGYFFRSRSTALIVPLGILGATDLVIGGYQPLLMAAVYGTLSLPILLRGPLRRCLTFAGSARQTALGVTALAGCTAACSLAFFLVTNFACWLVTPWYPRTVSGLWQCYLAALPFFRYTLAGDLVFAAAAFAIYAAVLRYATARQSRAVSATAL